MCVKFERIELLPPGEMWRAVVTIADACAGPTYENPVGLSAGRREDRECFVDCVSPVVLGDATDAERAAIARQRKQIAKALERPFGTKQVSGRTVTVGISTCGLFAPRPGPGAYVVIGCRRRPPMGKIPESYGGIEHVVTVLAWEGTEFIEVSEAGQVDREYGGLQCVKRGRYRWLMRSGRPWLVSATNGAPKSAPGRRVLGWGDPARFRYRAEGIWVPEGFE